MMHKKQFIAGARCPKCQCLDTMVVYHYHTNDYCECIECGFKERRPGSPSNDHHSELGDKLEEKNDNK